MLKAAVQSAGWYKHEDALASFEFIKECGFDAVDFNIDIYLDTEKLAKERVYVTQRGAQSIFEKSLEEVVEFFKPLKEASEKTGVSICQMHAPFNSWFINNEEANEELVTVIDKCLAVCEYVGCPAIVVHPTYRGTFELQHMSDRMMYRSLIPIVKKYKGVKICLENIFYRLPTKRIIEGRLSDSREAVELIDLLNSEAGGDYFGFCLDVGHAILTRKNIKEYIKALGDRLTVLHIHDNNGDNDLHVIPYTCLDTASNKPICDWDGFVDGLREIGYKGTICFETFRIFHMFPKAVQPEALKLVSAIGRHWAERIEAPDEE